MSIRMCFLKSVSVLLFALLSMAASANSITVTYYHNDATGSPVAATNQQGQVVWRKTYTPFGETSNKDGDNKIGFTGHTEDQNGLVYAGARYYDPALGRFMGTDSVGFNEKNLMSFNRYAYANNNPYKYVDPDGRDPLFGALVGGAAGLVSSGVSTYIASGGKWGPTFAAAGTGAVFGAMVGSCDPTFGIGTLALYAGTAGSAAAIGDIIGQAIPQMANRDNLDINYSEAAGAGVGAAIVAPFGVEGAIVKGAAANYMSKKATTAIVQTAGTANATLTTLLGTFLGEDNKHSKLPLINR